MATNFVLLEKITVGSAGASSVTFSSIPQTGYTDLVIKASARTSRASDEDGMGLYFNADTSNYTWRTLFGNGSSASSVTQTSGYGATWISRVDGANATSNTFASVDIYIPNYTSSNYKSYSVDGVTENNGTTAYSNLTAPLFSSTAAITSATLVGGNAPFIQYSTFYLYGVAKLGTTPAIQPYATGGDTILTDGTYWYHTFLSSGTFTPTKALSVDYLVVAGGGGGGIAGGGAGGLRCTVGATGGGGSLESKLSLGTSAYTVTVGAGGGGYSQGSNSVFSTITSTGGGAGQISSPGAGGSGGSGGGAAGNYNSPAQTGGAGTANQGYAGGGTDNFTSPTANTVGGGGGGAGAVGGNGTRATTDASQGGNGGNGVATSISGSSVTYAGGGGGVGTGSIYRNGTGGTGGGGNASGGGVPGNGTANTGGGGGGGYSVSFGSGGSGIVIVRYPV